MIQMNNSALLKANITDGNVCLKFSAEWCNPCRILGEMIEGLESDYPNVKFIEVDVDEVDDANILTEYKIKNIPALFFMKDGEIVKKEVGSMSKDYLNETLKEIF